MTGQYHPRLNGQAQTISFWAGSMLSDALESMEVLYSTEGTDIGDFQICDSLQ